MGSSIKMGQWHLEMYPGESIFEKRLDHCCLPQSLDFNDMEHIVGTEGKNTFRKVDISSDSTSKQKRIACRNTIGYRYANVPDNSRSEARLYHQSLKSAGGFEVDEVVGLRGPAEMLGVAVLPCQTFLKETVIGSVRHSSEKLLKTLKIGSLIRQYTQKNGDDKTSKTRIPP